MSSAPSQPSWKRALYRRLSARLRLLTDPPEQSADRFLRLGMLAEAQGNHAAALQAYRMAQETAGLRKGTTGRPSKDEQLSDFSALVRAAIQAEAQGIEPLAPADDGDTEQEPEAEPEAEET